MGCTKSKARVTQSDYGSDDEEDPPTAPPVPSNFGNVPGLDIEDNSKKKSMTTKGGGKDIEKGAYICVDDSDESDREATGSTPVKEQYTAVQVWKDTKDIEKSYKIKADKSKHVPMGKDFVAQAGQEVENYIPLKYVDLTKRLLDVYEKPISLSKQSKEAFFELAGIIALRNKVRLAAGYMPFKNMYGFVDPDVGDGANSTAKKAPISEIDMLIATFEDKLGEVVGACEFEELKGKELEAAKAATSPGGLDCHQVDERVVHYRIYVRGAREIMMPVRELKNFYRLTDVPIRRYSRILMLFRQRPGWQEALAQDPWWKRFGRWISNVNLVMDERLLYMKLYKDINAADVDMMLPGARIKFSLLDRALVYGPLLGGVASGIYKMTKGSLWDIHDSKQLMNTLLTVVAPLMYAVKAYFAMKTKEADYDALLNKTFLLHNLNNNAGVITQLIDEAEEQDNNETLLAYFFLWQGADDPPPMTREMLDTYCEIFLRQVLDEQGHGNVLLDFEVDDALTKLIDVGVVKEFAAADGTKMVKAVGIAEALQLLHLRTWDNLRETGAIKHRGTGKKAEVEQANEGKKTKDSARKSKVKGRK